MLNFEMVKKFYNNSKNDINLNDTIKNIREQGIYIPCFNEEVISKTQNTFNIELPETKIYNQAEKGESYLCWIYAYISFIKPLICEKLNIKDKDLDLSINYIHFFDRLDKTNSLYEEIIYNNLSFDNNLDEKIVNKYIHNQGSFCNVKEIIQKYGIVPDSEMPMNINNYQPIVFDKIFREKIKKDILEILKLTDIKEMERYKDKCLQENYILLSKIYGQPPISFNFNYTNISKKEFRYNNITPKEFLKICFPEDINDYIFVMNNNKYPFYDKYPYDDFTQIYNNNHYFYNLPIDVIKEALIKQLKAGCPIWFGSDFRAVCGTSLNKVGILDCNLIDLKNSLGIEILPKIEQERFNSNNYNHAMVIVGVQIEDDKPIRWKVQNSYGKESNQNGYLVMNDNFFNEYAVMFGINKKFIGN